MSLSFQPQTEEEVLNLLPAGIYDFVVKEAIDTYSKASGNPMIKLSLELVDASGKERVMTDFILTAFMKKIKHFCDATNLIDKYNSGTLSAEDCIGKTGKLNLIVEEYKSNLKNSVEDYIKNSGNQPKNSLYRAITETQPPAASSFVDDDLPF